MWSYVNWWIILHSRNLSKELWPFKSEFCFPCMVLDKHWEFMLCSVLFLFECPQTPLCQVKQSMTRLTSLQFSFISIIFQTCLLEATPWSPWSDTGVSQVPTINPFINHLSGYGLLTSAPLASYYCKLLDIFSLLVSEWDFIPKFWGLLH